MENNTDSDEEYLFDDGVNIFYNPQNKNGEPVLLVMVCSCLRLCYQPLLSQLSISCPVNGTFCQACLGSLSVQRKMFDGLITVCNLLQDLQVRKQKPWHLSQQWVLAALLKCQTSM